MQTQICEWMCSNVKLNVIHLSFTHLFNAFILAFLSAKLLYCRHQLIWPVSYTPTVWSMCGVGGLIDLQLSKQLNRLNIFTTELVLFFASLVLHIYSNCNSSGKDLLSRFIWASSLRIQRLMRTASPRCIKFCCYS